MDPYPGQEERNASMLLEEGAGTAPAELLQVPIAVRIVRCLRGRYLDLGLS